MNVNFDYDGRAASVNPIGITVERGASRTTADETLRTEPPSIPGLVVKVMAILIITYNKC